MQKPHFSIKKHAYAAEMSDEKNASPSPFCQGKSRFMAKFSLIHPYIAEIID